MLAVDDNGWLVSDEATIARKISPNVGGKLVPEGIIIHYTAATNAKGSVNWLCNPASSASAHLVIDQQGNITQLAPFTTVTWHAGKSSWKNKIGCNHFTIGIELANAGMLSKLSDGTFKDSNSGIHKVAFEGKSRNPDNKCNYWDPYTSSQVSVTTAVCLAIKEKYGVSFTVGHEDISPGRKSDPGPAFPLEILQNRLFGSRK